MAGKFNISLLAESPDQRFDLPWLERDAIGFIGHIHASHLLHFLFVLGLFPCIADDEFVIQLPLVGHDEAHGFPRPHIQPGLVHTDVEGSDLDGTINLGSLARMPEGGGLYRRGRVEGKQQQYRHARLFYFSVQVHGTPFPVGLFSVCFWIICTNRTQYALQFFEVRCSAGLVIRIAGGIKSLRQGGDKLYV